MLYPDYFEKHFVVNSRDVDGQHICRTSALLAYLQDISAEHSALCNCGRQHMVEQYNVFWMLTRLHLKLTHPIRWLDNIKIRTWHRGGKGIFLYREYELFLEDNLIGQATALWVLPDVSSRKMLNFKSVDIPGISESKRTEYALDQRLTALHVPDLSIQIETRIMRYSESDVNGHINNTRYADFCSDCLAQEITGAADISDFAITYHGECYPGELIQLFDYAQDNSHTISGIDTNGLVRFVAQLTLRNQS